MLYAFLSSPVTGLRDIRKSVHNLKLPGNRKIWVDEIDNFQPKDELKEKDTFNDTLEGLFQRIREAHVFLILLGSDWYGTGLQIGGQDAHVSYWEAELYYAILLGKRVHVIEVEGFQAEGKLYALLEMLRRALPRTAWSVPYPRSKVVKAIHEYLLKQIAVPADQPKVTRRLRSMLVDGFFKLRGTDGRGGTAEKESLQFFDGSFVDTTVIPNETVISQLLNEVRNLSDEEGRLTRLWVLYRELSSAPPGSRDKSELLPYWNLFYGEWASAGSWYGLHGHPNLAVLPALIQQAKVRKQMRKMGSSVWQEEDTSYPGGALASSRYSIAGRSGSFRISRFLLRAALGDLNRSLNEGPGGMMNLLAIRGSVYRKLGAIWAAVNDYESVLRMRQKIGASEGAVGEAMSELGYGYLFQFRFWKGRALIEEGVRLLSTSNSRPGFLVRAQRKLSVSYWLTGHPRRARDVLVEAHGLARTHGVLDQIR
jgi:hypothetical protein